MPFALENKLITRGFGSARSIQESAGLVVQGYSSSVPIVIITALKERPLRLRMVGQSGTKRRLAEMDNVILWAKLVEMNDKPPPVKVEGWIHVKVQRSLNKASVMAEHVGSRVRDIWETVKVTITRLK